MADLSKSESLLHHVFNEMPSGYLGNRISDIYGNIGLQYKTIDAVRSKMIKNLTENGDEVFSIPAMNALIERSAEQMMRETYVQAYGKEYDSADRRQSPLPLGLAYSVALQHLEKEGNYTKREEIKPEDKVRTFVFKDGSKFVVKFIDNDGKLFPVLLYITQQDSTVAILREEKSLAQLALDEAGKHKVGFDEALASLIKSKVFAKTYADGGTVDSENKKTGANSMMEQGGMIQHGFHSGDAIIEIYKGYGIVENKNSGVIEVINPNEGTRYIVDLDDSKSSGNRQSSGMNYDEQINAARDYILNLPVVNSQRFNIMTELDKDAEGTFYTNRFLFNMGGDYKEDDNDKDKDYIIVDIKNAEGQKKSEYYLNNKDWGLVDTVMKAGTYQLHFKKVKENKSDKDDDKMPNPADSKNYVTIDIRSAAGQKKAEQYHNNENWKLINTGLDRLQFQKIKEDKKEKSTSPAKKKIIIKTEDDVVNLPQELYTYKLKWDTGKGSISTMCKSIKIAKEVQAILAEYGISATLMNADKRIVVIYPENSKKRGGVVAPKKATKATPKSKLLLKYK